MQGKPGLGRPGGAENSREIRFVSILFCWDQTSGRRIGLGCCGGKISHPQQQQPHPSAFCALIFIFFFPLFHSFHLVQENPRTTACLGLEGSLKILQFMGAPSTIPAPTWPWTPGLQILFERSYKPQRNPTESPFSFGASAAPRFLCWNLHSRTRL